MINVGPTGSLFRRRHEVSAARAPPGATADDVMDWANIKGDEFQFGDLKAKAFKIFLARSARLRRKCGDTSFRNLRAIILQALKSGCENYFENLCRYEEKDYADAHFVASSVVQ